MSQLTWSALPVSDDLDRAQATLRRGAAVFAKGPATWPLRSRSAHALRSKVLGNGLRELDRFLNLLIDAVARDEGFTVLSSQRNTANKLRDFRLERAIDDGDHPRLLALGRSRNCLFHCGGIATYKGAPDTGTMVLGWPDGPKRGEPLKRVPVGQPIMMVPADLESVGRFYADLADMLVCRVARSAAFSLHSPLPFVGAVPPAGAQLQSK